MEIWTPYGNQKVREFGVLVVRHKESGKTIRIKDFKFNPLLHEVLGEEEKVLTTEDSILKAKDEISSELELKTRKELEEFGLSKGFSKAEMKVCLNKKSLVELLVSR
jgi:hypothetical protein